MSPRVMEAITAARIETLAWPDFAMAAPAERRLRVRSFLTETEVRPLTPTLRAQRAVLVATLNAIDAEALAQ